MGSKCRAHSWFIERPGQSRRLTSGKYFRGKRPAAEERERERKDAEKKLSRKKKEKTSVMEAVRATYRVISVKKSKEKKRDTLK